MSRPTVLTFIDYYLPGCKGGGPLRTLAGMVDSLGDRVRFRLVTRDRDMHDTEPYPNCHTGAWKAVGRADVMYLPPGRRGFRSLRRIINDTPHDVLYLNSLFSPAYTVVPLILRRLGLIARRPVVLAPRGELSPGALRLRRFKKELYLTAAKAAGLYRGVIWQASAELEEEDIRRWFGDAQVYVAPDMSARPTDVARLQLYRSKEPGSLSIAFLSRIARKKNLDGALRLLAGLRGKIEFHIYGPPEDPAYWKECGQLIEQLPPGVTAVPHGPVAHQQILEVLRRHHVFLLPTHGENFGHVILEALLAGCPVILSDQTPWRGLQGKGVGWDFPLEQPEQFRRALQTCVDMDNAQFQAMSRSAREYGVTVASDGEVVEQNLHLLQEAANRRLAA